MRHLVLLSFFCLAFTLSNAQQDSLRREIQNYAATNSQLISNGRNLLLDSFIEGDISKVKEVRDYLINQAQNQDYLALYPGENWLLMYWTEEYQELLKDIVLFDETRIEQLGRQIKPSDDLLYSKLNERTIGAKQQIITGIKNASLPEVDKDFLLLFLEYMLTNPAEPQEEQKRINLLADEFLVKYPNSGYENYVRENLRVKLVRSNWGLAFEFFSGYGVFTDDLAGGFQNNIPMGIAFDVEFKNLTLYLRNYIGFSLTKTDHPFEDGVWEKGSQVRVFLPEASFGYTVLDNNHWKISPFAGIASTSISPTDFDIDKKEELEDAGLDFTTTYTAGLNIDFKLDWNTGMLTLDESKHSYWFIRLRYGYASPQFGVANSGSMHYITLGFGGLGRGSKRQL